MKLLTVSFLDIVKAHKKLQGQVLHTPLISSAALSALAGADVWLKLECQQKTGSFKVRGALNKIASLTAEELARGVITASAGNHAQGVAYAAALRGVSALIVVPSTAPETKKAGIRRYGAELVEHGNSYDEAESYAYELAKATGRTFVHAFEDDHIIAGQGTAGLEAMLAEPDFDAILVPAGGGGLICGVALAAKAINPQVQVIGVQTHASPPWYYSFREKRLADVVYSDSLADGLHGGISQGNLDLALEIVDDFVLVEEEHVAQAMYWLAKEHHLMVEGSGVVGVAALMQGVVGELAGKKVLTIVSGSNVDAAKLAGIVARYS
ncbi:threonine/serine dehydratase [Brevibacillus agri]|uniref:threonine ammonia-lyase n=1 Tax=Brevibacillus agri TaxID=51101 RepID=UPI001C8E93E6|nr:threonine/serine dehydratase [Brevibacillus agri]MBY0054715.1 threonine/serine dehydratase [Brevibacillus agri]MED1821982.1 threonine/serine dehydratase [Brevibacillus agri]